MSRIKRKNTRPEMALRHALWAAGLRYRLQHPVTGKPDIAFPGAKVAVFVDGCFWHGCPEHGTKPATNADFWRRKIAKNQARDVKVTAGLVSDGWHVMRFWEHELKRDLSWVAAEIMECVGLRSADKGVGRRRAGVQY